MDQFKDWSTKIAINYDSDSFDRLRYIYTNYFILGVAFFVFSKSYVGEAVQCWVPAQFQGGWESYVENYCLIENTYFSRFNATRLPPKEDREKLEMLYYQWVPFILCGIALSLYAPRVIWKLLHGALGGGETLKKNLKKLRTAAKNFETADDVLLLRTEGRAGNKQFLGARLTFALLFCKALALLVLVANLCYLNYILGNEFHRFWGVSVFWDLLKGHEWHSSGNFPRVTFCDVEVRELGSINRWTLQCVLMVNMFNEKFFLLLWIWFLVLLVLGVANLFLWLFRSFSASSRNSFVRSLLVMSGEESATLNDAEYLVDRRLGLDGVSLLRLAATNSTDFVAARQLVLWKEEQGNGEQKDSKG